MFRFQNGFTLIELLVVISILSLLSSIIFASVNSARGQAEIAAGKQFDDQITKKLYLDAYYVVGDASGSSVTNDGKENLSGTLIGATVTSDSIKGDAYAFNTNDARIVFPYSDNFENQLTNNSFVWSAWIKPNDIVTEQPIIANRRSDSFNFGIRDGALFARFNDREIRTEAIIQTNQWQHVAISYENNSGITESVFYLNGAETSQVAGDDLDGYDSDIVRVDTPFNIYIGYEQRGGREFNGIIDEPKMFAGKLR